MDKFIEMVKKMEQMPPEEKKQLMEKNRPMCMCVGCPSYITCMREKDERLYCLTGKSECSVEMKGCICPTCPVKSIMELKNAYYCVKGSEKEIRGI